MQEGEKDRIARYKQKRKLMERIKLAKQIHQIAKDKGWWDNEREDDEIFMLIITELAEAVEADRNEAWVSIGDFEQYEKSLTRPPELFVELIKDTVEDELADAYIRCLDYLYYRYQDNITFPAFIFIPADNFAKNVFSICRTVSDRRIMEAAIMIEDFCVREGIDLEWHVKEKTAFNKTRKHKHGKSY